MTTRTRRQSTNADGDIAALRDNVSEIGSQLTALLDRAKTDGTALAEAELSALQTRLQDIAGELKGRGREALDRVEETVKEHPAGSLLAAFAAGALLTVLLRR
jgi:ElaB/YqjD/DUF883 family membrane-anchored ribosome-binding protein